MVCRLSTQRLEAETFKVTPMAMTKKERAEFDAAIERAEMLAALRWTNPVVPDVPIPEWDKVSTGFSQNAYTMRVERMWSRSNLHGIGEYSPFKHGSQHGRRLYSTELLAWKAMRAELEMRMARELMQIDRKIKTLEDAK